MVAIGIVGAIAAISIPSLISGIQKKILVTKLKSEFLSIQQLIGEQMVTNKTKDLRNTDFADPATLLSSSNFSIAESCATPKDCWSETYTRLSDGAVSNRVTESTSKSVKLKNGTILSYIIVEKSYPVLPDGDKVLGLFYIDVNGKDKPNIVGRDYFWMLVTNKGKLVDYYVGLGKTYKEGEALAGCKSTNIITACLSVVQQNNWTMPY